MNAILLFSHGSTLCGAGENLRLLARQMERDGAAPIVEQGFLNYSEPGFEAAFERCVDRGATSIAIAPYFLVAGYFVKVSLPPKIEVMTARFPRVQVTVADALKDHPQLAAAVLNCAGRTQTSDRWDDVVNQAPQWCRDLEQCPLHATPACPHVVRQPDLEPPAPAAVPLPPTDPTALLVMVHGSPRPESNRDMFAVVERVRTTNSYPVVQVGFMECNEPDIPTAIATCVAQGARRVIAVPYFLHTGTHVAQDLPGLLRDAQEAHPTVEFFLGDYVGHDPLLGEVLADRVAAI